MKRHFVPFMFLCTVVFPQDIAPIEGRYTDSSTIDFQLGENVLRMTDFQLTKPWLGDWVVAFTIDNKTAHPIGNVTFNFIFTSKTGSTVGVARSDGKMNVPSYTLDFIPEVTWVQVARRITIPKNLHPFGVSGVKVILTNYSLQESSAEVKVKAENEEKIKKDLAQKEEEEETAENLKAQNYADYLKEREVELTQSKTIKVPKLSAKKVVAKTKSAWGKPYKSKTTDSTVTYRSAAEMADQNSRDYQALIRAAQQSGMSEEEARKLVIGLAAGYTRATGNSITH